MLITYQCGCGYDPAIAMGVRIVYRNVGIRNLDCAPVNIRIKTHTLVIIINFIGLFQVENLP